MVVNVAEKSGREREQPRPTISVSPCRAKFVMELAGCSATVPERYLSHGERRWMASLAVVDGRVAPIGEEHFFAVFCFAASEQATPLCRHRQCR